MRGNSDSKRSELTLNRHSKSSRGTDTYRLWVAILLKERSKLMTTGKRSKSFKIIKTSRPSVNEMMLQFVPGAYL